MPPEIQQQLVTFSLFLSVSVPLSLSVFVYFQPTLQQTFDILIDERELIDEDVIVTSITLNVENHQGALSRMH